MCDQAGVITFPAKLVHSDHRISGRPATRHLAPLHVDDFHQFLLALFVHQSHHPLFDVIFRKEVMIHFGNYIHKGIANAVDVVLYILHFAQC